MIIIGFQQHKWGSGKDNAADRLSEACSRPPWLISREDLSVWWNQQCELSTWLNCLAYHLTRSLLYNGLQSVGWGYLLLKPGQTCETMSIIENIMRITVLGRLDTCTYLDRASCPDHPEALVALIITCQPFLCAQDKFECLPAPAN